jgi:hypothetical protein
MAIKTLHGLISGMLPPEDLIKIGANMKAAGIHHSFLYTAGRPGAAVAPAPGIAGAALTTYPGQIPFVNPGVLNNSYLARFAINSTLAGVAFLYDRLWHNSGIAVTTITAQTVNSVAWPARDRNGLTDGNGVMLALEASTATTNAGAITNTTASYTNDAGVSGRTATIASWPATATAGTFVPFALQAGDTGVRSVQTVTLGTSYGAGAVHLVAYRPITSVPVVAANSGSFVDAISAGMPELYNNTVPWLVWLPTSVTGVTLFGQMIVSQG